MVLDKIPGPTIFTQRDVRETPAATATATSLSVIDATYVTLSNNADLTAERILTVGEGLNLSDGGANNNVTISGENASDTNKGIAKFQLSDFSVSSGDVSLKAVVVMSVDGDTGTATPALNNLDILGGTGISTVGTANDITITSTHASDDGSSHANVVSNTSASHAQSHTIVSHSDTTATGAELDTLTGGGDTTLHDHDGISENTTHRSSDGSDHSLIANKTSYWSARGGAFLPAIAAQEQNRTTVSSMTYFIGDTNQVIYCPVNLPHGAVVTGVIVYGADTDGVWLLIRKTVNGNTQVTMATAVIDTEDTSISNATIDNSTYAYFLETSSPTTDQVIEGARITYTTDYN